MDKEKIKKYWYVLMGLFIISMIFEPAFCAIILGGIFLGMGIWVTYELIQLKKNALVTEGEIHSIELARNSDEVNNIKVKFQTEDGKEIIGYPIFLTEYWSSFGSKRKKRTSQKVMVIYNSKRPKYFSIAKDKTENILILVFFSIVGAAILVAGILELIGVMDLFN